MYNLSDDEIDFILKDIQTHGVTAEDLQHDLLDHMCCIIENEMNEQANFFEFYLEVRVRFYQKNLSEIQEERDKLFTFKEYYVMKNTLKFTGLTSAFLTITGAVLKILHLPGAGVTIVLGGLLFSLIFLPLMIALKFRDEEKQTDKWVLSFGLLLAMGITTGMIFKLMHWPFANVLVLTGLIGFIFIYIPLYYLTRIRRPELKFNTTINSVLMMACGGILFAMYNLGYNSSQNDSNQALLVRMEQNMSALEEKLNEPTLKLADSVLYYEATQFVDEINRFELELRAEMEHLSMSLAKQKSISSISNPKDLKRIATYFSSPNEEKTVNEFLSALNRWNETIQKRAQKPIDLEKSTLQNSTYIDVLLHCNALKEQVILTVL